MWIVNELTCLRTEINNRIKLELTEVREKKGKIKQAQTPSENAHQQNDKNTNSFDCIISSFVRAYFVSFFISVVAFHACLVFGRSTAHKMCMATRNAIDDDVLIMSVGIFHFVSFRRFSSCFVYANSQNVRKTAIETWWAWKMYDDSSCWWI